MVVGIHRRYCQLSCIPDLFGEEGPGIYSKMNDEVTCEGIWKPYN